MSKLLITLLAAVFAAVTVTPVAFAAKHEMETKKEEGKKKSEGKKSEGKKSEGKKAEEKK